MEFRILNSSETLEGLHLVWNVFVQDVAQDYTPEGLSAFREFIKYDNIMAMVSDGQLIVFGAVEDGHPVGVLAIQNDGFIRLFYVAKDRQGQGIGGRLFQSVYNYCAQVLKVDKITVHAAPGAVEKYLHLGLGRMGNVQEQGGRKFVPMEMYVSQDHVQPVEKRSGRRGLIIGIIIVAVVVVLIFVGGSMLIRNFYNSSQEESEQPSIGDEYGFWEEDPYGGEDGSGGEFGNLPYNGEKSYGDEDTQDGASALDVPAHVDDSLSYEITEDNYNYVDEEAQTMIVEFVVNYPQVKGLKGDMDKKVNQALEDCAMETVNAIYINPSTEMKEQVLEAEYPVLASHLTYKVCYANENFMSVAYTGFSYRGSLDDYYNEFRTVNINLQDGTVYQVKDIVTLDDNFINAWLTSMRKEASNEELLSEMSTEDMKKALEGDTMDGVYTVNFFVDEDGIEIGFVFHYPEDDEHDQGFAWVTAPFTFSEIEKYATDSVFWKNLD